MKTTELGSKRLPTKYRDWLIRYVEKHSLLGLVLRGFSLYILVVLLFTFAYWTPVAILEQEAIQQEAILRAPDQTPITGFWSTLYFSIITTLTMGHGDIVPWGLGRILAASEALFGIGIFGIWVGIVVLKLTLPAKDSIVFSKYCYYVEDKGDFVVVFINTNRQPMVNAAMSSILKTGRNFVVRSAYTSPYIGDSAWTFAVDRLQKNTIPRLQLWPDDGLKFCISGSYGFANFAASIKYSFNDVLVIPTREPLTSNPNLRDPDLSSDAFATAFHYEPINACTFLEYAKKAGATVRTSLSNGS